MTRITVWPVARGDRGRRAAGAADAAACCLRARRISRSPPSAATGVRRSTPSRPCGPDVLFLDVRMPGMDGFDVLRELGADAVPAVVFVTAYDRYAVQAFERHAVEYLLKPFTDERFADVVDHVRRRLRERALASVGERLPDLLAETAARKRSRGSSSSRTARART